VLLVFLERHPIGDSLEDPGFIAQDIQRMTLRGGGVRLWEMPLRIALVGNGIEDFRGTVEKAASTAFNVLVELVPRTEYGLVAARMGAQNQGGDYLTEHTLCYTVTELGTGPNSRSHRATVVIPNELPDVEVSTPDS
jgi:hypothetical protein